MEIPNGTLSQDKLRLQNMILNKESNKKKQLNFFKYVFYILANTINSNSVSACHRTWIWKIKNVIFIFYWDEGHKISIEMTFRLSILGQFLELTESLSYFFLANIQDFWLKQFDILYQLLMKLWISGTTNKLQWIIKNDNKQKSW